MSRPGYTGIFPPSDSLDVKFTDTLRKLAGTMLTPVVPCSEALIKPSYLIQGLKKPDFCHLDDAACLSDTCRLSHSAELRVDSSSSRRRKKKSKSNTVLSGHWFAAERQQRAGGKKKRKLIAER